MKFHKVFLVIMALENVSVNVSVFGKRHVKVKNLFAFFRPLCKKLNQNCPPDIMKNVYT